MTKEELELARKLATKLDSVESEFARDFLAHIDDLQSRLDAATTPPLDEIHGRATSIRSLLTHIANLQFRLNAATTPLTEVPDDVYETFDSFFCQSETSAQQCVLAAINADRATRADSVVKDSLTTESTESSLCACGHHKEWHETVEIGYCTAEYHTHGATKCDCKKYAPAVIPTPRISDEQYREYSIRHLISAERYMTMAEKIYDPRFQIANGIFSQFSDIRGSWRERAADAFSAADAFLAEMRKSEP